MPAGTPSTTPTMRPTLTAPASQPRSVQRPIARAVTAIRRPPASAGGNARRWAGSTSGSIAKPARRPSGLCDSTTRLIARNPYDFVASRARRFSGDLALVAARQLLAAADERVRELHALEQVHDVDRGSDRERGHDGVDRRVRPVPAPVRVRRHELRREGGERERQAPAVEVEHGAALREPDSLEAVMQVLAVGFVHGLAVL